MQLSPMGLILCSTTLSVATWKLRLTDDAFRNVSTFEEHSWCWWPPPYQRHLGAGCSVPICGNALGWSFMQYFDGFLKGLYWKDRLMLREGAWWLSGLLFAALWSYRMLGERRRLRFHTECLQGRQNVSDRTASADSSSGRVSAKQTFPLFSLFTGCRTANCSADLILFLRPLETGSADSLLRRGYRF